MKRIAAVLALWSIAACGATSERELDRTFDAATLTMRRGELTAALDGADRALALTASQPESQSAWKVRLLRAEILLAKPDLPQALPLLAQPLPDAPQFAPLRARQKYLVARSQVLQGRLPDALGSLDEVARLAPDDRELQLDAEVLGGQVRLRLGRWSDAESRLGSAAAEARKRGDHYREVLALNNLGMGMVVRNRCDEALTWFERVLSFQDLSEMLVYSGALNNAGACYARLGQFDRAVSLQERAVAMHRQRGAATYHEQALGELGSTYFLQNDVDRAIPYFQQALKIATDIDNRDDAALWAGNLAAAHVYLAQWDDAEKFNDEAKRLTPPIRASRLAWNTLYAGRIAAGRRQHGEAVRQFERALAGSEGQPRVRWAAHEGLAGVAIASGDKAAAARHFEAALDAIERTRSDLLKTDYKLSFLTELIRFYRAYVDMLVDQGSVERALEVADSSRGRVLADRHGVTPPARARAAAFRQLAADSGSVLVSYWLAPARSYVWIADRQGVRVRTLPPAAEIEALVGQHQAAIQNALADPLSTRDGPGDRLFRLLVEPALGSLGPGGSIVIVPDGALHGLNFETLPVDGPRRHYWIEDVEVQIAPALALLTEPRGAPDTTPSLLLIGDPAGDDPQFPALRFASTEMSNIVRHFGPDRSRRYQGVQASPAAYRDARPEQFSFVHFAAHAAASLESPLDSAVILAGQNGAFKLYAREVAELPLDADLVTISACRGAGERAYSGEGLVGFAWAFLRAGARRVIAGLWDVDDRSTAELMDTLYGRLAAGDGAPRALRQAKLELISRGGTTAKPYYWAPFQVFTVALTPSARPHAR
jgi:tetratricopeptide (TPR) repeat protein